MEFCAAAQNIMQHSHTFPRTERAENVKNYYNELSELLIIHCLPVFENIGSVTRQLQELKTFRRTTLQV